MYRNIIIGYDGSPQAEDALAFGSQLAEVTGGSTSLAVVLRLDPWLGAQNPALEADEVEQGKRVEDVAARVGAQAEKILAPHPREASTDWPRSGTPISSLLDLLITAGPARSWPAALGIALLHGALCPVAIAPRGYADTTSGGIRQVSVGFDGSAEASIGLDRPHWSWRGPPELRSRSSPWRSRPRSSTAKAVGPTYAWHALTEDIKRIMRGRLDDAVASLPDDVEVEATLLVGKASYKLAEAAADSGGLLIVGSRGYGPVRRVLLGSVSAELVRSAPCPVIVHPRSAEHDTETREATATATA